MIILAFLAIIVAFIAFQRAARAERALAQQREEFERLRAWLTQWYEQSVAHARAGGATSPAAAQGAAAGVSTGGATDGSATTVVVTGAPVVVVATDGSSVTTVSGAPLVTTGTAGTPASTPAGATGGASPSLPGQALPGQALPTYAVPAGAAAASQATPALAAHAASQAAGGPHVAGAAGPGIATPSAPTRATRDEEADAIESQIGGRWLLYIGIAALVLGASYFVKYAFDNQWITEPMRVGLALLGGLALVFAGQRFVSRGLALYGQVLTGGGVGVLYLAIYAAQQWYGLMNQPTASVAMIVTTVFAVWLADRQRSQPLALFAIIAGFATPFLIGDDPGSQTPLFLYDAVLVCGTIALARRRDWPMLNLASYTLALFTIATWLSLSYDPRHYLLTEAFLTLFLVLFLWLWREMDRYRTPGADLGRILFAFAPVLYHLASVWLLFPQRGALLVYLIVFSTVGVMAARQMQRPWLRIATWIGAAIPLLAFFVRGVPTGWVLGAWVALLAIYGLHLFGQFDRIDDEPGPLPWEEALLLHANGIWLLFAADLLLRPRMADAEARSSLALALFYALIAFATRNWRRDVTLHATALTATFVAATAGFYFDGPWFTIALALDGAALMYLALRESRAWMFTWGAVILTLAVVRTVAQITTPTPVSYLPILNPRALAGLFVVGMMALVAWLSSRPRADGTRPFAVARDILIVGANLLALFVLSSEVYQYFDRRAWTMGVGADLRSETVRREVEHNAEFSRELTLSLLWAVYAVGMVFAGIKRHYRPIRYFAIALFALTILKVFTVDLATLDRVSKMLSVMGLGVFLLLASYLYQRVSRDAARQAKLDAAARAAESQPPAASEPAATADAPTAVAPAVSPEPTDPVRPASGPATPDGSPNDAH